MIELTIDYYYYWIMWSNLLHLASYTLILKLATTKEKIKTETKTKTKKKKQLEKCYARSLYRIFQYAI